jgi:hypothetical protein
MVTVDELLATLEALAVTPFGAVVVAVPAELVYQITVPLVPEAILAVVTAKVAVPPVPPAIVPDWAPMLTVGVRMVSVATAEAVELKVTVK